VEEFVAVVTGGLGQGRAGLLAPPLGARAGGGERVRPAGRGRGEVGPRLHDPTHQPIDPVSRGRLARPRPQAHDAAAQPLDERLGDQAGRQIEPGKERFELLEVDLGLARLAEPAAQAAHRPSRALRGLGLEQRAPHGQGLGEAAGGDPEVVDGLGVAAVAHAAGGRGHRGEPPVEVLADPGGDAGAFVHRRAQAPLVVPASSWGCRASRRRTRSDRASATSSTGRVASSVSKSYSSARRSSWPMTRAW